VGDAVIQIGLAVMGATGAIVAALFKREVKRIDDKAAETTKTVSEIHKNVFGYETQPGLRERTTALETQSKALEAKSEILFEKLDKILSKIEAITELLARYNTETELVKSSVRRIEDKRNQN
jgi:chromosome segregation ATPase